MGDINVDFQKAVNPIQDNLDVFDLTNLVKGPTCFKNHFHPSVVDVILTTCPRQMSSFDNITICVSDHHNIIIASTKMHANHYTKKQITYRLYQHFNQQDYINDLLCATLHVSQVFDDVEDQLWFHNRLYSLKEKNSKITATSIHEWGPPKGNKC